MNAVEIVGWSLLSSAGLGGRALAARLAGADLSALPVDEGADVGSLYEEPMPSRSGHALDGFTAREHLGRKGTGSYDRATALAVVCCQEALRDSGLEVSATVRPRVGVALGTTLGSFKSTSDFSRETLVQDKPYLVNPMLFPNTVMNCAAGQVAIRFGLRGVNATIAGGPLAFLNAVRYAASTIGRGYADMMLTGAVEEFTPHRAWSAHLTGSPAPAGEAAGVFVLAAPSEDAAAPRILSVATGYGPGGPAQAERALGGCVARALARAGVAPEDVHAVATGEGEKDDLSEYGPATAVLGREPVRVTVKSLLGECDAAGGAAALALLLVAAPPGALSLLTARGADGAVGAAIVKGPGDGGSDRG